MCAKEEDRFSQAACFHSKQHLNPKQTNVIHKGLAASHCNRIPDKNLGIHATCKHPGLTQDILVNFRSMPFDIIILYLNQLSSFAMQSKLGVCHSSRLKKKKHFMLAFVSSVYFFPLLLLAILFFPTLLKNVDTSWLQRPVLQRDRLLHNTACQAGTAFHTLTEDILLMCIGRTQKKSA